jgi:arylsulfatase A-like enzyme
LREVVLARVGVGLRPAEARPVLGARVRRLDTQTRNALPATAKGFEVDVPANATALVFSTAALEPAEGGPVRFLVKLRSGTSGPWRTLIEDSDAGPLWRDHQVSLPAIGDVRTLRFLAELDSSDREALWGSILLLGVDASGVARPNILLVSLDTLGADYLGAFSNRNDVSPHLDAFLAQAASFRRAYTQYGATLTSHASLFTALQPRRHGVMEGSSATLQGSLVEDLAADGYRTTAFTEGGFVSAGFGFGVGFDAYDDGTLDFAGAAAEGAAATFDRAAAWLEAHPRERVFVFLHTYEVHSPYLPRDERALDVAARETPGDDRVFSRRQQLGIWGRSRRGGEIPPEDRARLRALYLAEVHTLDAALGRLLARLSELGLTEQTLVVVTADHGEQFGEWDRIGHAESLHNRVLHVPLGFRWPGMVPNVAVESPVQLVDVMPTVFELAGVPAPMGLDGHSLVPLLRDPAAPSRPAFSEQHQDPIDCLRLRLPERRCQEVDRVAVQTDRYKLVSSLFPSYTRLYDLASDPQEERDVSGDWPDVVRELTTLGDRHRAQTSPLPDATAPREVDADTVERLRDLGYLEGPDLGEVPGP